MPFSMSWISSNAALISLELLLAGPAQIHMKQFCNTELWCENCLTVQKVAMDTVTLSPPHTYRHTQRCAHTCTHAHPRMHHITHTHHTHTHTHTLIHTHTHTHTHTNSHTHHKHTSCTHTHAHTKPKGSLTDFCLFQSFQYNVCCDTLYPDGELAHWKWQQQKEEVKNLKKKKKKLYH